MPQLERLLSPGELAAYLEVPRSTVYAWRYRRQEPPGFRVGRHLRYRISDVETWVNAPLDEQRGG